MEKQQEMEEATVAFSQPAIHHNELTIPVPWGHISAKVWGDPCSKPVLCVHGMQDNAGSFDRLIPLLPSCFYYVCIDLPGHGLSSRYPKGVLLEYMLFVGAIVRVVKHFKWTQFYYIGHSLGGRIGVFYAAHYPEQVQKLILLDSTSATPTSSEKYVDRFTNYSEKIMEIEDKLFDKQPPSYTYEEALERLIKNRPFYITKEAAIALLHRSLKKSNKGYYFSTDQRLKTMIMNPMNTYQYYSMLSRINTSLLLIFTNATFHAVQSGAFNEISIFAGSEVDLKALDIYEQNCNFKMVLVDGHHDVHNNEPEKVASWVSTWLISQQAQL